MSSKGFNTKGRRKRQAEEPSPSSSFTGPVADEFARAKMVLDDKHDRYERLVKLSRDVTIESKRAIFLLHRALKDRIAEVLEEATDAIDRIITGPLRKMALELENQDPHQYIKAYSAGLQEFVEAVSLLYFLENDTLLTINHISEKLKYDKMEDMRAKAENPETVTDVSNTHTPTQSLEDNLTSSTISLPLNQMDFILGIADLTGELMRRAINSIGVGDYNTPFKLCEVLQIIEGCFRVYCTSASIEMRRKISVLSQSVSKVENACYTIKLRRTEMPEHLLTESILSSSSGQITMAAYDKDTD